MNSVTNSKKDKYNVTFNKKGIGLEFEQQIATEVTKLQPNEFKIILHIDGKGQTMIRMSSDGTVTTITQRVEKDGLFRKSIKYEIKNVKMSDDYAFLRIPEIRAETSSLNVLSRSVSKKMSHKFIKTLYLDSVEKSFYEVFIRTDLENLRKIDSDKDEQERFINKRFPPEIAANNFINGRLLPIIFLMIDINPGDQISEKDLDYINDILTWPANIIYTTPLLNFNDSISREKRLIFYEDFISRLLENKNTLSNNIRVGISIPTLYRGRQIPDAFKLYDTENNEPAFVTIDFERNRITSSKMIGVVNSIHRYFKRLNSEKYAIYGFNVKPFKRGGDYAVAEDIGCFISGINAIGDTYKLNNNNRIFIPAPKEMADLPKIFDNDDYKYLKLVDKDVQNKFISWYEKSYGAQFNNTRLKKYARYTSLYNTISVGREANDISQMLKSNENKELKKRLSNKDITKITWELFK